MTNTAQPSKRRFGIGRRTLIGIGVIALMIVIALVVANPPGRATAVPAGPATVAVTRGKIIGSVSGSGAIAAEQSVDLYFQTTGNVKAVAVAEGDGAGRPGARRSGHRRLAAFAGERPGCAQPAAGALRPDADRRRGL